MNVEEFKLKIIKLKFGLWLKKRTFELEQVLCQIMVNFTKDWVKDYCNNIILMVKKFR